MLFTLFLMFLLRAKAAQRGVLIGGEPALAFWWGYEGFLPPTSIGSPRSDLHKNKHTLQGSAMLIVFYTHRGQLYSPC